MRRETAMAAAFLRALMRWARRHRDTAIAIPTGVPDPHELARVIVALGQIRRQPPRVEILGRSARRSVAPGKLPCGHTCSPGLPGD